MRLPCVLLLWLCLAQASTAVAQAAPADTALRAELLRLRDADQKLREGFGQAAQANDTAYMRRMIAFDSASTRRLVELVRAHGWPSRALVGADGEDAAWLLLQHSPSDSLQRALLPLLWAAARRGERPMGGVAMLEDRVRAHAGERQRFGNSFSLRDGRLVADPIEDLAGLDARRREAGLPPMAEYVKLMAEMFQLPVEWPPRDAP